MIIRLGLAIMVGLCATAASAQSLKSTSYSTTMKDLLDQGYEIKAAVPNGTKFIVFMQKDQSAYACEFVSVTQTRCGAIN